MNQHVTQPTAEPAGAHSIPAPDQEARNMRSLALQLRRNGHEQRRWANEAARKGKLDAALAMLKRADRYAADAIWYWRRAAMRTVQFNTEDAS